MTVDNDRLLELFDEMPTFASVVEGPEYQVVMVNRRIRESSGSAVGKKVSDFYPGDNPLRRALDRVYSTGVAETVHDQPPPDGSSPDRYFTRSFVPLRDGPGGVKRILVMIYEVTDAVRARHSIEAEHERLYAVLEEAPVPIIVLEGPELRIAMMNRITRANLGERVAIGTAMRDVLPVGNSARVAIERVFATGVPETFEGQVRDFAGYVGTTYTITVVPVPEPNGKHTRVMMLTIDTTKQTRALAALQSQATELELARQTAIEAGKAKDEFLAMLGHELRNPLAPMLTALHVIREQGATAASLGILERQMRHLTRLVDDLLDVSRISRGKITLHRRRVELASMVNRAIELAGRLLEERDHRVVTTLVRNLAVFGDPDRLAQVVSNLITNAAKYSDPGSQIRIEVRRAGSRAELTVSDDGAGIAPEMIATVFDAFVQQPQTLDRAEGGLGLGLAIVKHLVEAHEGTVSARSDGPGRGSTFTVSLPALEATRVEEESLPVVVRARAESSCAAPLRVLVVDDNRDAINILRIALEARGHDVAVAYDGASALEVAATHAPQVALVDIGLPVMNGYRLAELLRASYGIPIVAITGYGQDSDRERSAAAGFAAHLVKPVDFGELSSLLERLAP